MLCGHVLLAQDDDNVYLLQRRVEGQQCMGASVHQGKTSCRIHGRDGSKA